MVNKHFTLLAFVAGFAIFYSSSADAQSKGASAHRTAGSARSHRSKSQKPAVPPASESVQPADSQDGARVIGKRIILADGTSFEVDEVWTAGDEVWYRRGGISKSLGSRARSIEPILAPETRKETAAEAAAKTAEPQTLAEAPTIWIYLVGGARFRVDEVSETSDGAWYNRGKLAVFLERERIDRIEREIPAVKSKSEWREQGWTSGNANIDALIRANGTRFGVDPYLVFLVIEQESQFHSRAVSPKGARGLMQLMPGTARRFSVRRPFDPVENIRGGTQYLKELMGMFNGRVDLVLASYNAGEGRVVTYGNRVPPFKETQDYVKRISRRYRNGTVSEDDSQRKPNEKQ